MKIKLYKGPFNGKTYTTDGRNELIVRGPKPLTRLQRYNLSKDRIAALTGNLPLVVTPHVEARYRIAMRTIQNGPSSFVNAPCTHPDGSVFYEYVEGSKREY